MKKSLLMFLLCFMSVWGMSQQHLVTGRVTDEAMEPVVGASIIIKGTTQGTITNFEGVYSLQLSDSNAKLVFSFIGMESQEIDLDGRKKLDVQLKPEFSDIEEVVVVGYGTQKKESVVAAISTISSTDIVRSPAANLSVGLAGKMPGLTIMQTSGELGAENVNLYIRGQASMNSTNPLILVDGIERGINNIDPYDIESISILKDASATAVYGVRGANGVILVTTRQGEVGKARVTANVNYSMQTLTRLPDPLNAIDYMNVRNEVVALDNPNNPVPYPEEVIDHYRNGDFPEYYRDRNWYEEFVNKYTPMVKGNVNMSGGTKKTKYFASLGYTRQGGPFKTERWDEYNYDNEQRLDRFTYRANFSTQITPTLKGWMNLSGSLQDKNDPIIRGDQPSAATTASWYYVLLAGFADRASILKGPNVDPDGNVVDGIYGQLNRTGYRVTTNNDIQNTVGFEQDLKMITKGLKAKVVASYDTKDTHIRGFRRTYSSFRAEMLKDAAGQDSAVVYNQTGTREDSELIPVLTQSNSTRFNLDASLNYNNSFGDHNVTGLFLYNQTQRIVNGAVPYKYVGIVGRATYGYKQRYLGEFNFGMNGSEQFAKGRRFGFFPSVSLGWVISEENFMKNSSAISFMKLRGSFGQVGNDRMGGSRFAYLDNWTQGSSDFFRGLGGYSGLPTPVYEKSMPNTLVTWEVANKSNIGLETNFINGFELDVDVFYEKRSSILMSQVPIPVYMFGQTALPKRNDGVMTNQGIEASLTYNKKLSDDLRVSTTLGGSFARNKIINANEVSLGDDFAYPYRVEGFSRGSIYGYDCLGYFKDEEEIAGWSSYESLGAVLPGDLKYKDQNDDGIIDERDKIRMNYTKVPELNLSYSLKVNYKGFDFSALLQGVTNYTFDFSQRGIWDWHGNNIDGLKNYFGLHKYAWTPEKQANSGDIRYPRMHIDGSSVSKLPSNYWLIDMWYVRLKNVELGYTFPKSMMKSIGLSNVRIYLNGLNLLTFDNMPFKYLDPELTNSLNHPLYANYNAGINITF
ncbi:SusC/RagA family TonB-linked outer membrane protein [Saccharicrinis sp. GN24d3]|uniref:SusC/RagA family TonB-linked outer membrane protein n=1 Tax=Saccharicrinis sp. GN24d3 TaxID=3458416 RepID=UPI004035E05E